MNTILLLLCIMLVVLMALGLRTMQEDHLFSIAHRAEMCLWITFTIYLFCTEFFGMQSQTRTVLQNNAIAIPQNALLLVESIFIGLVTSRIFAMAALTLGNPPRVRIEVTDKAKATLVPEAMTPGVKLEKDGQHASVIF